ncbi:uncharacterized protein FIBRA_06792 [Fibroporia radiculosa]|uniref:SGNH hydrolase-type esterase domain-containing protein n=1 Tax=Fibroporia radiculosa TaxID=599839 RepID=J4GTI6_9APHY|nr:uncharacterized protein FIBRA_06792 [Fibroporia radiculosa]CCM04610.1 predicted protein [Fibroporia radiculosa]
MGSVISRSSRINASDSVTNSTTITTGPHWRGLQNISHLIIFGDSYSDVGYRPKYSPAPTKDNPLGEPFPASTYSEPDTPNWVGHLITKYLSHGSVLVYDYAVGGDTVRGVSTQVRAGFLPGAGQKPTWAPWSSTDALFITWIGINDCGFGGKEQIQKSINKLFEEQEELFSVGARNFLFIDIPPVHVSPTCQSLRKRRGEAASHIFEFWNSELRSRISVFSTSHPAATVMLFSSWDTFMRILNDPISHGFEKEDIAKSRGSFWVDHLHPTTKVHDWIAKDLYEFLVAQSTHTSTE